LNLESFIRVRDFCNLIRDDVRISLFDVADLEILPRAREECDEDALARKIIGRMNGTREIEHGRVRVVAPVVVAAHISAADDKKGEDGAEKRQELFHHDTPFVFHYYIGKKYQLQ